MSKVLQSEHYYEDYFLDSAIQNDTRPNFSSLAQSTAKILRAKGCILRIYNPSNDKLEINSCFGFDINDLPSPLLDSDSGIAGWVFKNRKSCNIANVNTDGRFINHTKLILYNLLSVPILHESRVYGTLTVYDKVNMKGFSKKDLWYLMIAADYVASNVEILFLSRKYQSYYHNSIYAFARAIEAKDTYTVGHSERVATMAVKLGHHMLLPERQIYNLKIAALLHDIGKIGICEDILNKDSRLTPEEYDNIKQHPRIGVKILQPLQMVEEVLAGIHYHHERYDGKGYPAGVQGDQIPLFARIIAVADAFDAITSDRAYKKGSNISTAVQKIEENMNKQFCPIVVNSFLSLIDCDNQQQRLDRLLPS
ncbi:MAG: HD domain-containing phosphohydrolase [Desulfosporosinus sp.]|nr:HD domain-containing phosphohydrolase [Desulfosporosinus sp.]